MIVSPGTKCEKCDNNMLYLLVENSADYICVKCGHTNKRYPLEDLHPGLTAKIIKARIDEEQGEENGD